MNSVRFGLGNRILRHLLLLSVVFLSLRSADAADHKYIAYVGTYTREDSKGIYAYRFDADSGETTPIGLVAETENPSFLTLDHDGHFLYAVNETEKYQGEASGAVSAFSVDSASGKLHFLDQVSSRGANPAYITLDRKEHYALVANYTGGSVATFPVKKDGSLGEAAGFVQHQGKGFIPGRQETPHAHMIVPSPNNRFALVADLALDKIIVYRFDAGKGALKAIDSDSATVDSGAGPRHIAFGQDGKFVYLLNEMQGTVDAFAFDEHSGALHPVQKISTLPNDFKGDDDSAELVVHPSGNFLYASNRGDDSIAVYSIDRHNGTLKLLQIAKTQGEIPRSFAIDPTGKWLWAANQKSNNIVLFQIDQAQGTITPTDHVLKVPVPVCVQFVSVK